MRCALSRACAGLGVTKVKFCGLTRAEDARVAAELGAAYVGVIFAGGPRLLDAVRARAVLDGATQLDDGAARPDAPRRVGVFADQSPQDIARIAAEARLDVVQLHGAADASRVRAVRGVFGGQLWRVVRVRAGDAAPLRGAGDAVDGVLVDALVDGALGGTGVSVDWRALAESLDQNGRPQTLVLAGGLRAENVANAIGLVAPDVVDVSSGVEAAVGVKDHERMRAFARAARGGS